MEECKDCEDNMPKVKPGDVVAINRGTMLVTTLCATEVGINVYIPPQGGIFGHSIHCGGS